MSEKFIENIKIYDLFLKENVEILISERTQRTDHKAT